MQKDIPCKWKPKEHRNRILIPGEIYFNSKAVTRHEEGHYIMIKGSIHQGYIISINIYAHNIGAPKYIKQMLTDLKGEIDKNTKILGDFHTPLSTMDRSYR